MKKKTKKIVAAVAVPTAVASVAALGCAYQFAFGRTKIGYKMALGTRDAAFNDARAFGAHKLSSMPCDTYEMESVRGSRIKGFYYPCSAEPSKKIVFFVHGRHTEHLEAAGLYYEYYHKKGFDVFACDHTGAGQSTGNLTGYGMFESQDVLNWIDFLMERFGEDIQIVLHGFSMGASAILKICDYCQECVKFIVSDSAYTNAATLLKAKSGPFYEPIRMINCVIGGYDLLDTQVISHVSDCDVPILFVHGEEDTVVPFDMALELFDICESEKDSLFVEGAGHVEAMYKTPRAYEKKLDSFIEKYIED